MLKITANSTENFTIIQNALKELEPYGEFFSYFKKAEQVEDTSSVTIILKNVKKFAKDLNKKKFIIYLPDVLEVDSYEFVTSFETVGRGRVPVGNIVMKCHMATNEVNFVIILTGFNDSNIRITKLNNVQTMIGSDEVEDYIPSDSVKDAVEEAIDDSTLVTDGEGIE